MEERASGFGLGFHGRVVVWCRKRNCGDGVVEVVAEEVVISLILVLRSRGGRREEVSMQAEMEKHTAST